MSVIVMDDVRGSLPRTMWAIALLYVDQVTKKRRTEVMVFGSKPDFNTWYERVKNNWNAVMEDCRDPGTGHALKVTATIFQTPIEWEPLEFVDSAPSWEPVAPTLPKKKRKAA